MALTREYRDQSRIGIEAESGPGTALSDRPVSDRLVSDRLFRQRLLGTSLLEVLASILIFSIGMLGYAAVQTRSLKESYDLQQRTIVLWQSQALIDRIRANRSAIDTYIGKVGRSDCSDMQSRPEKLCQDTGPDHETATCTSQEVAEYDSWDVICNLPGTTISGETIDDTPIELSVSLSCADGSAPCPPRQGLVLTYSWVSKAALDDPQISKSAENPENPIPPGA